ncbi:MAG: tetratricopeptide repeat protein [Acidobacteria bacterium]|nr:tetratricopeptide repeat protein [Acidobacteriota bacterium]
MSFDKTKSMRNAERFLSQGKIRAAISEYQRIVESDPKDFSTLNILGDLYAKGNETEDAVKCFKQVAEHYNKQGFAQKAIAIYNKFLRLDPHSPEVLEKLAQLHQSRGSNAEARNHYAALADQYQKQGKKAEALEIWKQIAKLDPNNTEVYLKVAEFCLQNGQKDEAAKAYTEAGIRLAASEQMESALTAFSRALEIRQYDLAALNGYVKAQIKLGYADDAARRLEKILEQSPYNREILYLLVDCHLESGNLTLAEESVIRLVEQEPANYPKFIDLVELYIKSGDLVSGARILSMSSEHLLVGGKHEEFRRWANEIVARDPEQIDALRLLVRYHGWQRDESELRRALERLAEIARLHQQVDDEKYALSQLVLIVPHEIGYAKRLQEIKIELGDFPMSDPPEPILAPVRQPAPQFSNFHIGDDFEPEGNRVPLDEFRDINDSPRFAADAEMSFAGTNGTSNGYAAISEDASVIVPESDIVPEFGDVELDDSPSETSEVGKPVETTTELSPAAEMRLSQELESVEFYIGQGYMELADRSITALEDEFGNRPEFDDLRARIAQTEPETETQQWPDDVSIGSEMPAVAVVDETPAIPVKPETPRIPVVEPTPVFGANASGNFLDEFRSELGLDEPKVAVDDDFDTIFHTATAYREMGLLEDSIRGFQDAVNRVRPDDGSRRFFQCCNLLGLCFMEKQMPNLAIMWYKRSLETPGLTSQENHAMLYELGNGYAFAGDQSKAIECFEQIYAVDVDYRDVSKRLEALHTPSPA